MFYTVKQKLDMMMADGYQSRYGTAQLIWERLRVEERVIMKKAENGRVVSQVIAVPDKVGVYFREIPLNEDFCRFHEGEVR